MFSKIFFVVIRSIVLPYLAVYLLINYTSVSEEVALIVVGIALIVTTFLSIAWNIVKIVGNSVLLRGQAVLVLVIQIAIQVLAVIIIWYYYFSEYTDVDLPKISEILNI